MIVAVIECNGDIDTVKAFVTTELFYGWAWERVCRDFAELEVIMSPVGTQSVRTASMQTLVETLCVYGHPNSKFNGRRDGAIAFSLVWETDEGGGAANHQAYKVTAYYTTLEI